MIYCSTITTPKLTDQGQAKKTLLEVNRGLIWKIEVEFPAGCCGLVHIQIFDGSYQLFPATPRESLRGEGVIVSYDDLYLKSFPPWQLKIVTWNEDEKYDHTLQIRIGMASQEAFMSRFMPSITWDKFSQVLAKTAATQEKEKTEAMEKLSTQTEGFTGE